MKKTLLITNFFPPAIGGIENYFANVCERLDPSSIVVLTTLHPNAAVFDASPKYKIIRAEFFSGMISPRWRPLKGKIKKIIKDEEINQIVFGHFHPYCLLGRKFHLPYFIFTHGTDVTQIKNNWWQKRSLKKVYRDSSLKKIIANSRYIYDELSRLIGNNAKLEIIYPGIDFDGLNKPVEDLVGQKQLLGLAEDDIVLLSMGRLEPEKNYSAVIKLMPEMLTKIPKLKYVIVGAGSDEENLRNLVQSLDLKFNVIFTGLVPNVTSAKSLYYQLAHIFITASQKPEGFGISYLEAAATRTAVIASKFGGSAEAVKDGETGLLIDPQKPEEIRDVIYKLALDKGLWQKMSSAGQVWAKNFDWSNQMKKIKEFLK